MKNDKSKLEAFLDEIIDTSAAVEDTAYEAVDLKADGEGVLGKGFIVAEKVGGTVELGKRLAGKAMRGEKVGTLGFLLEVGGHLLKK